MKARTSRFKLFILFIAISFLTVSSSRATQPGSAENPDTNRFFEFDSGFWINLHHFLYLQAVLATPGARNDGALAVQRAIPVREMTLKQRAAWDKALAYYRQFGSSDALRDRELIKANYELSDAGNNQSLAGRDLPPELIAALEQAAPVYRTLWWNEQDRQNRNWIEAASRLVHKYGQTLADRIALIYRTPWPAEKIPVEVVSYANWAGAYTTLNSTLITVSSLPADQGDAELETLFHEASHALIDGVSRAISQQCRTQGVVLKPPTLWHAVIFYTTGELVKELIPGYDPLADRSGLWKRAWPMYIGPLENDWQPYLDGKLSFNSAVANLVKDIGQAKH
jgi:hypothetical protein